MSKVFFNHKLVTRGQWRQFGDYDTPQEAQQVADDMNREAKRDSTGYFYQVRFSATVGNSP